MKLFEKIFNKRESKSEEVHIDELVNWIIKNSTLNDTHEKVFILFTQINDLKKEISERLKVLGETDVSVRQNEMRLRLLVEGNRDNYIRVMHEFLQKINTPSEIGGGLNFCEGFARELDNLNKRTSRNFYIMQNLIGSELVDIAKSIKKMEDLVNEANKLLNDQKIQRLQVVYNKINDIKTDEELNQRIKELENKKEELQKKKDALFDYLGDLKDKDDYRILITLRQKLKRVRDTADNFENEIKSLFGPVDKSLKKFERMYEGSSVLMLYKDDFVKGLVEDSELKIIDALKELSDKIGRLALKDPDRVLRAIVEIRKDKLIALRNGYIDSRNRADDLQKKICENEIEEVVRNKELDIVRIDQEIKEVVNQIDSIKSVDRDKIMNELRNEVMVLTNMDVVIKGAIGR